MKINTPILSTAALTSGAYTSASFAHDVSIVELDDDGVHTILPGSLPGQNGTFNA